MQYLKALICSFLADASGRSNSGCVNIVSMLLSLLPAFCCSLPAACCAGQSSLPLLGNFTAADFARFLDGLERMRVPPGDEWATEFFRVSADRIVRTAERVRWGQ